jgi:hypothetical protein
VIDVSTKRLFKLANVFKLVFCWRSLLNPICHIRFGSSRLTQRGLSVLAIFLLALCLQLVLPTLATAQLDAVACSIDTDIKQCHSPEVLANSLIAQSPDATAPLNTPPASQPVVLPKQRIDDRIAHPRKLASTHWWF